MACETPGHADHRHVEVAEPPGHLLVQRHQPLAGVDDEQHHAGDADGQVLTVEVGTRTFLDRGGDRNHALIAGGLAQDPARRDDSEQDRENGAAQRQ